MATVIPEKQDRAANRKKKGSRGAATSAVSHLIEVTGVGVAHAAYGVAVRCAPERAGSEHAAVARLVWRGLLNDDVGALTSPWTAGQGQTAAGAPFGQCCRS
ncbi:hypothetical protein [Streptomyces jumonjinensis]|uniref:Uncharacterized protein n=1 Tax=Streptomyces jumonjinensis TaxID=1945 RepID=A0A646KMW1_STRJU|nr:hypothetical protein [Streptomyces jumonjinensis]MQT03664.1 hypothetical protein [Streptomyces jumonjinensis]